MSLRILCAGDSFITADDLADQCRQQLAEFGPLELITHVSRWPDEPMGDVDGVREAAGDPAEIAVLAADVDVIVTHLAPITAAVFESAGKLRVVGSTRGGPVNIDIAAATEAGVPVAFLPGRNLSAAAEFAVGLMIAVTRNIGAGSRGLADGRWEGKYYRYALTGPEIGHCAVGLIGYGAIGAHVTRLLLAFGAKVLVYDPYTDASKIDSAGARSVALDELLATADIVSLHARLTPETTGMADATFFAAMKPGSFFINNARGELVRTDDLTAALTSGHLAGAGLDVFDPEPPPADHPLLAMPRVVATPHLAGASQHVAHHSAETVVGQVALFLRTGTIAHCANPSALPVASV
ncbi:D-3-phosphoglycerate dehydrogenase [Nakamurella sp. UYEF19]|uniref:2-hydroxyacid dehydrogenase n=1 Tax=Nakamurella sp. UYEF19 TaxID=1756392 RepID=UPI00339925CC